MPGPPSEAEIRPDASEHNAYYTRYVERVPDGDIVVTLERQGRETMATLAGIGEARSLHRYAPGKWSIKDVVGHVTDAERVFALRALAFSRGEVARLFGFDQDAWVRTAGFDRRPFRDLVAEFEAVRRATLLQLAGLDAEQWRRRGVANEVEASVRALAWIIAGHERHHLEILRERYL
jgi:hypothetical protein